MLKSEKSADTFVNTGNISGPPNYGEGFGEIVTPSVSPEQFAAAAAIVATNRRFDDFSASLQPSTDTAKIVMTDELQRLLDDMKEKNKIAECQAELGKQIDYKYAEGQIISDFKSYIDKTYDEHYKGDDNIECFDAWIALGTASGTFRDTSMKYLWRYGRKNGFNKDDLFKALHYTLLILYNDHYKG